MSYPPSPKSAHMKNENSLENSKSPINSPGFGVRALCAALLIAPICLGGYLWFLSRPVEPVVTLVQASTR